MGLAVVSARHKISRRDIAFNGQVSMKSIPRSRPSVGIYQPLYHESIRPYLDPGFITLDWRHNPAPALREFVLHEHICNFRLFEKHDLTGLLSPKFFSKTGLTSWELMDWIAENPGHEIYCIDGRPFVPYAFYNSIERAVRGHPPDYEGRMRRVCSAIGFDLPVELGRQTGRQTIHCNYWIATPAFWERWENEIVRPISRLREEGGNLAREVFAQTPYRSPTPVFLITFIYERLMSYYIQTKGIDAAMFPFSAERIISLEYRSAMKRSLEQMTAWVDEIDRRGEWTPFERARLTKFYDEWLDHEDSLAHEAATFDPGNFDLPARTPRVG
jgi:hypothetical protein